MTAEQAAPATGERRRTHCKHGHLLDEANTLPDYRGWRRCRTCKYALEKVYPVRRRERGHRRQPRDPWRTHCKQGHPLDGENLYVYPDDARECRTCRKAYMQAYKARQREQRAPTPKAPRTHCKLGHALEGDNL